MTQDDTPMWEDPRESSALRQLLRAGRVENSDYDVERGLARHLAQLQAGAPIPAWAVQSTLQKSAGWSVLAWILPPMISAAVVGAWLAIRPAEPTALAAAAARQSATQDIAAPAVAPSQEVVTTVAAAPEPAAAPVPERDLIEQSDQRERRDHHVSASTRNVRLVARAASARRARGSRADDSRWDEGSNYATANVGRSSGSSGITASADGTAAASSAAVSGTLNPSSKAAASEELAPKQEPAIDDAKAKDKAKDKDKDKDAKAKPESRSKEQEAAQDEVTGARLEREMRMLAVAQRVLTEDPERSLRLCRQGESEFRGSMFSAERKQVALLALVQLGRVDQARREGIPFLRAYPNAPWSARLREALASGHLPNR